MLKLMQLLPLITATFLCHLKYIKLKDLPYEQEKFSTFLQFFNILLSRQQMSEAPPRLKYAEKMYRVLVERYEH